MNTASVGTRQGRLCEQISQVVSGWRTSSGSPGTSMPKLVNVVWMDQQAELIQGDFHNYLTMRIVLRSSALFSASNPCVCLASHFAQIIAAMASNAGKARYRASV